MRTCIHDQLLCLKDIQKYRYTESLARGCRFTMLFTMLLPQAFSLLTTLTLSTQFTGFKENVRAAEGSPSHLPCPSPFGFDGKVVFKWKKIGSPGIICEYNVNREISSVVSCKSQFKVTGQPPKLYVTEPKSTDSGLYTCFISRVIPPPTIENSSSVDLQVTETYHEDNLLTIICVSTSIGVVAIAAVTISIYKCRQRTNDEGDSVSYNNKVYENFSFSTQTQQRQTTTASIQEQCIYEN
ncbi:uncharacterized protein LOC110533458 isoform X2 [Oncorhynchus mykiss]|uniref:uncharacterized protein LOC110533458 isoform X2 n=1 Tax=Oncorhynchus mykiss TaxID=8022 RepID=UPI001877C20E|nr:uncharacterized protein LOC110533458 isoform X2 [Oncorhynchus mykiss]